MSTCKKEDGCDALDVHQQNAFFPLKPSVYFRFQLYHQTLTQSAPGMHLAFASAGQIPLAPRLPALTIPGVIGNDINVEVNIHMLSICHQSMLHLGSI